MLNIREKLDKERFAAWAAPTAHISLILAAFISVVWELFSLERKLVGSIGFTLDDSWIHLAIAKNLIEGAGFGINPDVWLPVSTAPAWTLLVAVFLKVLGDPVLAALLPAALLGLVSVFLVYAAVRTLTRSGNVGLLAAVAYLAHPLTIWGIGSGMELSLAAAAIALLFWAYYTFGPQSAWRRYLVPAALALGALARPELLVAIPLVLGDTFFAVRRIGGRAATRVAVMTVLIQGCVMAAMLAPYFMFNLVTIDHLFPTTFYAKTSTRGVGIGAFLDDPSWRFAVKVLLEEPLNQLRTVINYLFVSSIILAAMLPIGALVFLRPFRDAVSERGSLLPLFLVALPLVMGAVAPTGTLSNAFHRYNVVFVPAFYMLGGLGFGFLMKRAGAVRIGRVLAVLIILGLPFQAHKALRSTASDVRVIEKLYVRMGKWIQENIPPTAKLAVNDIGAVAYFSRNEILDIMGLASPEMWPIIKRRNPTKPKIFELREFLRGQQVDYLIVSPHYYPGLITPHDPECDEIQRWRAGRVHGRKISPQILYRCYWEGDLIED